MDSPAPQENVKPLRMLVFSMGLVLMGGTVVLIGMVWKKISQEGVAPRATACEGGKLDMSGRGIITHSAVDGNKLRLTLQNRGTELEVVTLELCSGKELGSVRIEADAVRIK